MGRLELAHCLLSVKPRETPGTTSKGKIPIKLQSTGVDHRGDNRAQCTGIENQNARITKFDGQEMKLELLRIVIALIFGYLLRVLPI